MNNETKINDFEIDEMMNNDKYDERKDNNYDKLFSLMYDNLSFISYDDDFLYFLIKNTLAYQSTMLELCQKCPILVNLFINLMNFLNI